jgi:hypothetical protein
MNIYKSPSGEILASENGCTQGWETLGTYDSITNSNRIFVIGFENGKAVFDVQALNERDFEFKKQEVTQKYIDKENLGIEFTGTFQTESGETIVNPRFQYDEISQNRLLKLKDYEDVYYWRSIDNKNVLLSVAQKNALYDTLIHEWATDFDNRIKELYS